MCGWAIISSGTASQNSTQIFKTAPQHLLVVFTGLYRSVGLQAMQADAVRSRKETNPMQQSYVKAKVPSRLMHGKII